MTKTETTAKQPDAPRLCGHEGRGSAIKASGPTIGAVWAHQDGKGFNVKLDYLPLNGAEIVIREPRVEQPPPDND